MRSLLAAIALLAALLGLAPALDLAASSLFHDGAGFPLSDNDAAEALRQGLWWAAIGAFLGSVALWAVSLVRPVLMPAGEWGWGALAFLLGPGLLVNGLLKEHWGRARPRDVAAFGGEDAFTPWWQPADQCASNCSFVSGEASAGAALALVLWVWLSPRVPRAPLLAALLLLVAASGGMRLAKGAHFASDVLMAWLLTALVGLALRRLLGLDRRS